MLSLVSEDDTFVPSVTCNSEVVIVATIVQRWLFIKRNKAVSLKQRTCQFFNTLRFLKSFCHCIFRKPQFYLGPHFNLFSHGKAKLLGYKYQSKSAKFGLGRYDCQRLISHQVCSGRDLFFFYFTPFEYP